MNLLVQVYKQVAPNGAFHPPLCWSAFQQLVRISILLLGQAQ
jgi:hypothetical protein